MARAFPRYSAPSFPWHDDEFPASAIGPDGCFIHVLGIGWGHDVVPGAGRAQRVFQCERGFRLEAQIDQRAILADVDVIRALPGRQAGAVKMEEGRFVSWGSNLFASTADGGFNCAGCHGGMSANGGVAPFAVTDPTTGEVKSVSWLAPSLNTVLYRFSDDEVRFILEYGRPFSPMSAWGTVGGGPMNEQQIQTLIEYMRSIQLPAEEDGSMPAAKRSELQDEALRLVASGEYGSLGEALFNIGVDGGAYSCARCHTKGYSYGAPQVTGGGAFGPNLTGGSSIRQFPNRADMISFLEAGSEYGKRYGEQGQGSGRMPGFGSIYSDEQIEAIVDYVRGL